MYKDRNEAGKRLSILLKDYKSSDAIVYALPRGGVPVGCVVAQQLKLPFEIMYIKKVGHPNFKEYAIGAVSATGNYVINEEEMYVDKKWISKEINIQKEEALRRKDLYYIEHKEIPILGRTVILIDDGVATGLTIILAIKELQAKNPKEIIVAVPVISHDAAMLVEKFSNKLVTPKKVGYFSGAVGNYYKSFHQLSDNNVIKLLSKMWRQF